MDLDLDKRPSQDALSYHGGVPKVVCACLPKLPLVRLRTKNDFLKVKKQGEKIFTPSFILQAAPRKGEEKEARVGWIVSKKVGNAVVRNKVKRRFRALVQEVFVGVGANSAGANSAGTHAVLSGWDYILVAHPSTAEKKYNEIKSDLTQAKEKLAKKQKNYA